MFWIQIITSQPAMKSWVLIFLGERTLLTYLIICMKRLLVQECSCTPRLFDHYQRAVQIHVQKMLHLLKTWFYHALFIAGWLEDARTSQ